MRPLNSLTYNISLLLTQTSQLSFPNKLDFSTWSIILNNFHLPLPKTSPTLMGQILLHLMSLVFLKSEKNIYLARNKNCYCISSDKHYHNKRSAPRGPCGQQMSPRPLQNLTVQLSVKSWHCTRLGVTAQSTSDLIWTDNLGRGLWTHLHFWTLTIPWSDGRRQLECWVEVN